MKHIFSILLSLAALFSSKAYAEDLGQLLPDVTYSIPEFQEVKASYTPSVTGPVRFLWTCSPLALFSSSDHNDGSAVNGEHAYTANGQLMTYPSLEAGHTYYIYSAMTIMGGELTISEGDASIEFLGSEPAAGGIFSASSNYRIDVDFNFPVNVGNCFLVANGERLRVDPMNGGTTLSFTVNDAVMSFYHDGIIKEGDTLTLRMLQLSDASNPDNKFGENGRLEIDFTVAAKPAELVETRGFSQKSAENPLNSFYLPGDTNAMMQLVFDAEIAVDSQPVAHITYGNPDNLDLGIYNEEIAGMVDGCSVTFDFSGKLRRRIDMLPGADASQLPSSLYVSYGGIFSGDGQRAYTGVLSNPTGFAASYLINELQYTVAADFLPARGSALCPDDDMEIWVMNGRMIAFDDICIDYVHGGVKATVAVDPESITSIPDPDSMTGDDMLFRFKIPHVDADLNSEMFVYMNGLVCADGLDHSGDVRGNFISGAPMSVDSVGTDTDSSADVYGVDGRLILRDATPASLRSLPAGLYIFNGKKIVI